MMRDTIVAVLVLGCAVAASAETIGAVDSRSAHASGAAGEADEPAHQPRHGGFFGDADDLYHYEVLLKAGRQLVLYVNDEHNRPLDVRRLTGRWTLHPDAADAIGGSFLPAEDGASFVATLPPGEDNPLHVKVAVQKAGAWAEMEFYLPTPGT